MALMMGNLYEALSSAGASPDEARKAAEDMAGYENRIVSVKGKLDRLDGKVDRLVWMVGVTMALVLLVLAAPPPVSHR